MEKNENINICPCAITIAMLSSKWKILIIRELLKGTCRYSDIRKQVVGISQKMLTQSLKELEADGLVSRRVYPEVPPRVEYSLTDDGNSIRPVIQVLDDWGAKYVEEKEPDYVATRFNLDAPKNSWMKIPYNEQL